MKQILSLTVYQQLFPGGLFSWKEADTRTSCLLGAFCISGARQGIIADSSVVHPT